MGPGNVVILVSTVIVGELPKTEKFNGPSDISVKYSFSCLAVKLFYLGVIDSDKDLGIPGQMVGI